MVLYVATCIKMFVRFDMYQNILLRQRKEFDSLYKELNRAAPYLSKTEKKDEVTRVMVKHRLPNLDSEQIEKTRSMLPEYIRQFQYYIEVWALSFDIDNGIARYYIKDESLFDFFKNTEVRKKEVEAILKQLDEEGTLGLWGILGKTQAYTLCYTKDTSGRHFITILSEEMNYTFCIEELDSKKTGSIEKFYLAMNFLFYIKAFPECVLDGVPPSEKKNTNAKVIGTSPKVVHHTTTEHGFITPHFRSGHFRHLDSDYYTNKKGQIIFVAATMVKGRAKTVLTKDGVA